MNLNPSKMRINATCMFKVSEYCNKCVLSSQITLNSNSNAIYEPKLKQISFKTVGAPANVSEGVVNGHLLSHFPSVVHIYMITLSHYYLPIR